MRPTLGWTMLSREEMRRVDRSLANAQHETRDEIGFLILHQAFADRFFPGTSVLHTRLRYVLFVPWIYHTAVFDRRSGRSADASRRDLFVELAIRLKKHGKEPYDVIGGDKLGQLTSQPPDYVYWSALRTWGLLLRGMSRNEALRQLELQKASARFRDDDGVELDDGEETVFAGCPNPPRGWNEADAPLNFFMGKEERGFLRRKLQSVVRPDGSERSLLARIVEARLSFPPNAPVLPKELDEIADQDDRQALSLARDAAALAAIGRTVYGALVEILRQEDGIQEKRFRKMLTTSLALYGPAALRFDVRKAASYVLLPEYFVDLLQQTQEFIQCGKTTAILDLLPVYRATEQRRKGCQRARLGNTPRAQERRFEWVPDRHNTDALHYRWRVVNGMLDDLKAPD